jgi:hypothetical protein
MDVLSVDSVQRLRDAIEALAEWRVEMHLYDSL